MSIFGDKIYDSKLEAILTHNAVFKLFCSVNKKASNLATLLKKAPKARACWATDCVE